jgi:hypothetical protein
MKNQFTENTLFASISEDDLILDEKADHKKLCEYL